MSQQSHNFSLWCDFIQKEFLENEFQTLIDSQIISGATSNPSIFAQALKTPIYQQQIQLLKGQKAKEIYEHLALSDIKRAAEILLPLWEKYPDNGYISIEIDPFLCDDAGKSIDEGIRLYQSIQKPNVMIKVPATQAGYEVMNALYTKGINVNATLIFTLEQTQKCLEALSVPKIQTQPRAVISVFVSRFDRAVDSLLYTKAPHLGAKIGIINAMECYDEIEHQGNSYIRTLFASTGVKGGDLKPSYYIDALKFPHSINTAPLDAIRAYQSDDIIKTPLDKKMRNDFFTEIESMGIHKDSVASTLLEEGLIAFKQSFEELLKSF